MTAQVVKLELVQVGEDYRFEADKILEAAKGRNFSRLVIVADFADEDEDSLYIAGTANAGESLILIHQAIREITGG